MNKNLIDHIDEHTGRLLAAIEHALAECNACDAFEASITLAMALEEHKARLAQMSKPTGASDKRWMSNGYDGQTFIDPSNFPLISRLWESDQDDTP